MTQIIASGQITIVDLNDAKALTAYVGSNSPKVQIYDPNTTTYSPNWATSNVVLTPQLYLTGSSTNIISQAKSISWDHDGTAIVSGTGGYTIGASNPNALTISQNLLSSSTTHLTINCTIVWTDPNFGADVSVTASFEFNFVQNGQNGQGSYTGFLSNDNCTLAADYTGHVSNYTNATTQMYVYIGSTDDSANWSFSASASTGITGSLSGATYTISNIADGTDSGTITITASKSGYSNVVKLFTVSKSKSGASSTAYWLTDSAGSIKKDSSGNYTPSNITIYGYSQSGTGNPTAYSGVFKFYTTTGTISNSTSWGSATTLPATGTATSATYPASGTFAAGITGIKAEMYLSDGTTLVDYQIIPVVADGVNSVIASVWTPNGNIMRNNTGSVMAQCDVYNGTTIVPTASVSFQWYMQDANVLADQGAGVGWGKIQVGNTYSGCSGYTSYQLTIPAAAINSVGAVKCAATYSGGTYYDTTSVIDQSDPIQLTLIADSGTVFKNGTGSSKNVTCHVYQAGTELDSGGSTYQYHWNMYKQDGTLDTTFCDYTITDPTAAPTFSNATTGGTLAGGTQYWYKYTWVTPYGESKPTTPVSYTVPTGTNTNKVTITIPALPSHVTQANIYVGTASGSEKLQGNTATTTYTLSSAYNSGGASAPGSSTASAPYKTGKTITVSPSEVTNIGNLVCSIYQ